MIEYDEKEHVEALQKEASIGVSHSLGIATNIQS